MGSIRSKRKWLSKIALLTVAALATTSLCGLLAGCKGNSDDEDETEAKSNPDTQLLKNGNFEFYEDNDGDYIYYTPDNWSKTSTGTTSYTASGIINTAPDQWDRMTSLQTAVKLYVNDLLSTYNSDEDLSSRYSDTYDDYHVEYAGLKDYDLLYKDPATVIDALDHLEDFADDDENILSINQFKSLLGDDGEDALQEVVNEYLLGSEGTTYINDFDEEEGETFLGTEDGIYIDNPYTHDKVISEDGTTYAATEYQAEHGNTQSIYRKTDKDDDDYDTKLYTNEDCTDALESSVLMIHNYLKNGNGTSQYYGASTTITLEANTAAKISVWVKTSDLYYHGYTPVKQNRGAYISVTQSVGSTALDNFKINSINTEKINPRPEATEENPDPEWENNGWVKYTVYVQACDYAETTISINLGLGGTENGGVCEGYAFFDDVEVTKYKSVNAMEDGETAFYTDPENEGLYENWDTNGDGEWTLEDVIKTDSDGKFLTKAEDTQGNYVTLLSEGDDKIFYADLYTVMTENGEDEDARYSGVFTYYIDLTSSSEKDYVTFDNGTLTMGPTIETVDNKDYTYPNIFVAGEDGELDYGENEKLKLKIDESNLVGDFSLTEYGKLYEELYVNENLSKIDIYNDFLANIIIPDYVQSADELEEYLVDTLRVDAEYDYLSLLAENLYTAAQLPNYSTPSKDGELSGAKTIIMLSATGASYTADLEDKELFTLEKDEYMILSLWVKTSDTKSNTAATLTIMDADDEDNNTSLSFQTTDVVTDIDEDEDIYNGWVQCFFYIHNDTDDAKTFKIRLQYGNTSISGTDLSAYTYGWAAFTNMQVLKITETEYDYTQTGTYAASFSFSDSDNRENSYFDDATKDSEIKENITDSSSYDGFNGGSSSVIMKDTMSNVDVKNSNDYAGLVNVDYFENYLKNMFNLNEDANWCEILCNLSKMNPNSEIDENYEWLRQLILSGSAYDYISISDALTSAEDLWREIFGSTTVQPLLIVNSLRTYTSSKETELASDQIDKGYYVYIASDDEKYNTDGLADHYMLVTGDNYEDLLEDGYSFYTLEQVYNYGFMGDSVTLSEDTYTAITVRVKVVGNTTAYIYLTETTKDRNVMSFEVPDYTFWYDDDGNVLKEEPDEDDDKYDRLANIAYELRDDGLYEIYADRDKYDFSDPNNVLKEDAWDYLYCNLNIYEIQYYKEDAEYWYYDGSGSPVMVSWDDLDTNIKYYGNEDFEYYAPHYLVSTTGTRVFTYAGEGTDSEMEGMNAVYYYYYYDEDDDTYTVSYDNKIKSFDTMYAEPRYTAEDFETAVYMYEITEDDCQGDYVTVSFLIHTGNEEKSYKLELWSGERDSSGVGASLEEDGTNAVTTLVNEDGSYVEIVYPTSNTTDGDGYVIFDYSYIELDESTYSGLMSEYVDNITNGYLDVILKYDDELLGSIRSYDENITYYREFVEENVDLSTMEDGELKEELEDELEYLDGLYTALYYTFTLYDSAAYVPFNNETAQEDETGYAFTMSDYDETLAYFSYKDTNSKLYTTFIDYATVNQEIEVNRVTSSEEDEEEESSTNAWILAASIVLVVALLATLVSMLVREIMKRHRINTSAKRNAKNRYIGGQRLVREQAGANGTSPDDGGGAEM